MNITTNFTTTTTTTWVITYKLCKNEWRKVEDGDIVVGKKNEGGRGI